MSLSPARVALVGAGGRMGAEIARLIAESSDLILALRVDPQAPTGSEGWAADLSSGRPGEIDGLIDFSSPAGFRMAIEAAGRLECSLVSGTTGVDEAGRQQLRTASLRVPVCWAPNFSIGAPILSRLIGDLAVRLPAGWQAEFVEVHHAQKRDAPSGTALRWIAAWRETRSGRLVFGREGATGPRDQEEIGVHAVRLGDVVGEHRAILGGTGETIEIVHRVQARTAFAAGCIEALRRLRTRGPGLHGWEDLLCGD